MIHFERIFIDRQVKAYALSIVHLIRYTKYEYRIIAHADTIFKKILDSVHILDYKDTRIVGTREKILQTSFQSLQKFEVESEVL